MIELLHDVRSKVINEKGACEFPVISPRALIPFPRILAELASCLGRMEATHLETKQLPT